MSVLQPWLEAIPIRMQSTLILGLRGPDTDRLPNIKTITRWLRGLAFKPGNPDNVADFMLDGMPARIVEKDPTARELEFVTQHYYTHLLHTLEVVAYRHDTLEIRNHAYGLFVDMCALFHLPPETRNDFEERLRTLEWPMGIQPGNASEALALLNDWRKEMAK